MAEPISRWIMHRNLRPFLELLSQAAGCSFDDTDWYTVELGVADTDEAIGRWYGYLLAGRRETFELHLAQGVGTERLRVGVGGAAAPEMRERADTLLSAFAVD